MISKIIENYIKGLREALSAVNEKKTEDIADELIAAKRVFVFGAGRSGLVGKAFAMRLMHLGKEVFFIGETITPAVLPGDVVFLISGSGNTSSVVNILKAAQQKNIKTLGITSCREGILYKEGKVVACINSDSCTAAGDYITMQILGVHRKVAPLGTTFESSALVYLDSLIVLLMAKLDKSEDDLKARHANIE